jgi:endo-1,4-beta-xylanase
MAPAVNPFLANTGGRYGWTLTPGCWYVVVAAEGYEPLTSPVVGIGSQVTDLDLELEPDSEPPSFPDVPETHQFWEDIIWMAERGITTGYPDGNFRPSWGVTRGSMAAFMARLDDVLGSAGAETRTACPGIGPFPDVGTTHPFCAEIAWMVGEDITTGFPDGTYRPGDGVTRQSMAAFMYRMAGSPNGLDPACGAAPLPDVPTSNPMCGEIAWMLAEDITGGYPDGTYRPGLAVSRQAMSAFMHRFADVID